MLLIYLSYKLADCFYSTGKVNWKNKRNRTTAASQPQRTVLMYFAIFNYVAHRLGPGETPGHSASHQASNYVQRS